MSYNLTCIGCKRPFKSFWPHTKSCSEDCRKIRNKEIYGITRIEGVASGTVGAISELEVSSDLLKRGYTVFRALSPSCFCDLIAIKNGKTFKIEVTTGYKNTVTGNIAHPKKYGEDTNVDVIAVWVNVENLVYYYHSGVKSAKTIEM